MAHHTADLPVDDPEQEIIGCLDTVIVDDGDWKSVAFEQGSIEESAVGCDGGPSSSSGPCAPVATPIAPAIPLPSLDSSTTVFTFHITAGDGKGSVSFYKRDKRWQATCACRKEHNKDCRKTKSGHKPSLKGNQLQGWCAAFLVAWVIHGSAETKNKTMASHKDYKPSKQIRRAVRDELNTTAAGRKLLSFERDRPTDITDSEPEECP